MQRGLNFCVLVAYEVQLYDRTLRGCPKSHEGRNQQPEQSFHEEEKKTPKTQAFDPLGYGHVAIIWRAARDSKMLMIVFANPLRLSGCETAQQQLSNTT